MTPNWFKITNASAADSPAEIRIYDRIGKDYWSDSGVEAKAFAEQLQAIPTSQLINLRVNSPGGNVFEGLAIYNVLKARGSKITCYVDGVAASIASVIALAADTVIIPENGLFMIHDPSGYCEGTAEDMEKAIQMLKACKDSIVSVYANETGQSEEVIREKMTAQTWFTGAEAVDFGFATKLTDKVDIAASLKTFDLSEFKNVPKFDNQTTASNSTDTRKMKPIHINRDPAAGDTAGGGGAATVSATAKTDQTGDIVSIKAQLDAVTAQLAAEKKSAIEKTIDGLVAEGRVEVGSRDFWVTAALKDPSVIAELRKNQPIRPPTDSIKPVIDLVNASISDIGKEMDRLRAPQASFQKGNNITVEQRIESANNAAIFHQKNRNRIMEVMNANTIGAGLKRQVLLQEIMRAFARRLLPLKAFSSVFSGIPLQGTNVVEVPYFPLVSTASTDFVTANGYVMGDSTHSTKTVTVNKRKYQPIRFTSDELTRQPALNLMKIGEAKAEKLAADVFADVLSLVTVANFGATPTTGAASAFDLADVLTLKGVADVADWPEVGRSIIVQSAVDVNLLGLAGVQSALAFGSSDPVQNGSIKKVYGFDYYMCNYVPSNAEQLLGFIAYMSAILFAGSPIGPTDEVRNQLTAYEVVTDPQTGATFEYRLWGNADMDERRQVIECNYGYGVGETAALKRIAVV